MWGWGRNKTLYGCVTLHYITILYSSIQNTSDCMSGTDLHCSKILKKPKKTCHFIKISVTSVMSHYSKYLSLNGEFTSSSSWNSGWCDFSFLEYFVCT